MSEPRILLHVGAHKTGTTAIQAFATRHHAELTKRGLHYPLLRRADGRLRSDSHNPLAHQFVRDVDTDYRGPDWLREQAERAGSGSLLLSAEAFWRHQLGHETTPWLEQRRAYLERVGQWLSPWPVEIVVVLREQAAFAHSVYLENIMKGTRRGRMHFLDFCAFLERRHLRYYENLLLLETHIGPIRLLSYDELAERGHLCHDFFAQLGHMTHDLPEPGRIRKSLSFTQARIKRSVIPLMLSPLIKESTNNFLRKWIGSSNRHSDPQGFWRSAEERQRWQGQYKEENEWIRDRYRPDLQELFPRGL